MMNGKIAVDPLRKPPWLKVRLPGGEADRRIARTLAELRLHSVCQEALCPNRGECFRAGTATFLILGDTCTRGCRYCHIRQGTPTPVDADEPERLVEAVRALGLRYVVITSVTRDDLPDGGAEHFARCIHLLRTRLPDCRIEVLIPDLQGSREALERIIDAGPEVINHNIEVARSLFPNLRPQGDYKRSLRLLAALHPHRDIVSKSGFMIGLGETRDAIVALLHDLAVVRCQRVTIGQYQQPTRRHWPVARYYPPAEFAEFRKIALGLGFRHVEAGPLVRSSYHAGIFSLDG
ncbi:MAG: lipoyl synthase [Syntrophales bacterium]|nr:lipoyl synthase [Syntrophales bacterium]